MKADRRLLYICGAVTLLCVLLLLGAALFGGSSPREAETPIEERASDLPAADRDYRESGEYAASAAWEAFRAGYDTDGSLFNAFLAGGVELDKQYEFYSVYSPEMEEELAGLLTKHGLTLHEGISYFYSAEELYAAADTGSFLRQGESCVGYLYDDGSFHFDGSAYLSGSLTTDYRFERQMRGVFSEETLALGSGEGWQSWTLETENKQLLHLAMGENECVIHAARPKSFVSVTVLKGAATAEKPNGLTAAALEELAACFDWNAIE